MEIYSKEFFSNTLQTNKKDAPLNAVDLIKKYDYMLDCRLIVGDPSLGRTDIIPVCRYLLLIHSSVFRKMLGDGEMGDPTGEQTHIRDVRPQVFKLMLRHMYGCLEDPEDIPMELALELILCADKYDVQPLVTKVSRVLMPTGASDVFPALSCVSLIFAPLLEPAVTRIVQEQTFKIINHPMFLELNDLAVEFIVKQEELVADEIDLWKALVNWANYQAKLSPGSSLRQLLTKPLQYLRFATLNHRDVVDSVIPTNILSSNEIVQLYQAIEKASSLDVAGLNGSRAIRFSLKNIYRNTSYTSEYDDSW